MVEDTIELVAPRAQQKHLDIASYVDHSLPRHVTGDAARLRQVLLNLLGNAIKFTERGAVTLTVEPGQGPDAIRFLVRDTGIGIGPDQSARIFLAFEQADSGAARKFGGTGLGLAIARRIVERMKGRIVLDSTPGAGSTFHFSISLPAADQDEAALAAPDLAGTHVLLVAPAATSASLLARRLIRWGASTCVVPDEKLATELICEREWSAILVDHALGTGP